MPRRLAVAAAVVGLTSLTAAGLAGCGSSSGGSSSTTAPAVTTTTARASNAKLTVLVSNDDGYSAEGIDTLVQGLRKVPGLTVVVVAPLTQESGTGSQTTPGTLKITAVKLKSGYPAKAVAGFPADTIRAAVDVLHVKADVAITGINEGQNLGPALNFSGTVAAARAAAARGIPALATSQGSGKPLDYASAVPLIVSWLREHRAALAAGKEPVAVHNLNVPTCTSGTLRGLVDVPPQIGGDLGRSLGQGDCASTVAKGSLPDDVTAFLNGYAVLDQIPSTP